MTFCHTTTLFLHSSCFLPRCIYLEKWEFTAKDGRQILVRTAQRGDASLLHEGFRSVVDEGLWLPTFSTSAHISDWIHWIEKTNHCREILLVAFLGEEYAGHITLQPEEWNASQHVAKLGIIVRKECRHVGVGCALMRAGEEIGIKNDYSKIVLSTFEDNKAARDLYEKLGYRTVGFRKNHFNMPKGFIDEVLMEKELIARI
ncbi:GNAT family N-acetyltransferase [Candidatus Thorarchaeota archaeon]|nr:MAG: GNAT family N-acetyltransferase [Candidatus Thorarchaeota archaeon]